MGPRLTVLAWALLPVILLAAILLAAGWLISDRFLVPKPYTLMPEFEILALEEDAEGVIVTLPVAEVPTQFSDVRKEGVYNLLWEGGYGRLGPVVSDAGGRVERRLFDIEGKPPRPGDPARLDVTIFHRDPQADHGIEYEELELAGSAGSLYAWWVDDGGDRAVLALHGRRRADRTETLRIMPTIVRSGWSVMSLAYRNHDLSAPSPDGLFHYGASEVEDALAGVAELRERGVAEIVLYGFSMGGAVALETVKRWPADAPRLAGIALDSPLLDTRTVIRQGVRKAGYPLPGLIADLGLFVGRFRAGVDWPGLDQRRSAADIDVPLLLFAGTGDSTIPVELVDDFVSRLEAPVDYRRLQRVDHVEGWNRDRDAYEGAVKAFLARLATNRR